MRSFPTCALVLLLGCGSDSKGNPDGGGDGATTGDGDTTMDGGGMDGASSCEPFGHFGAATVTFTLPVKSGDVIGYADIQKSFPMVDWANLDRLYVPAGTYKQMQLGNLPTRDPKKPLVITNLGGQVVIGPAPTGNYLWSMGGGSGWILTGRYDPDSKTGDVGFQGHRCGAYANSAGKYGFLSDDQYALQAPYLHMGIAASDATKFEIEWVEVERSGFAGIRLLNSRAANDPAKPMESVRVHDVYVHDTDGEGFYFGWTGQPPSNLLPDLQIWNVRILRTGNETLQIQDLGEGSHVHHNVFASGGLHWLDNGLGRYQDNTSQILIRGGNVEIDHNVFVDGAGSMINQFNISEQGDPPENATLHDNYFANTLSGGPYTGGASQMGGKIAYTNNSFRGLVWAYDIIAPGMGTTVIGLDNTFLGTLTLTNNTWEGTRMLAPNSAKITQMGNTNGPVTELEFQNAGWPFVPGHHLTSWVTTATVPMPNVPVSFKKDDIVKHGPNPDLYRAKMDTNVGPPDMHPEAWDKLPKPSDDMRVKTAAYAGYGVQ